MPKLSVTVPHNLGETEAARRVKARYDSVKTNGHGEVKGLQEEWEGNTLRCRFQAMGLEVAGTVTAAPSAVTVDADIPLAAALFRKAIEKRVRDELGKILG
jgi:hypothetical protein